MTDRSCRDDYAEMMTLLPEGNRQIVAAIGKGISKLGRSFAGWLGHAIHQREPEDNYLP
jgi:hypothetical protein